MRFFVSDVYVRRQQRKYLLITLFMSLVAVGGLLMATSGEGLFWGLVSAWFGSSTALSAWKARKNGVDTYPVFETQDEPAQVAVSYKDMVVTVALPEIAQMRLQRDGDKLLTILLKTAAGQNVRVEGYENMGQLGDFLRKYVPEDKVVTAKWFHR